MLICQRFFIALFVSGMFIAGCDSDAEVPSDSKPKEAYQAYTFGNATVAHPLTTPITVRVTRSLDTIIPLSLGQLDFTTTPNVDSHFTAYAGTSWSFEESPDEIPEYLGLTFEPKDLAATETTTNLRVIMPDWLRDVETFNMNVVVNRPGSMQTTIPLRIEVAYPPIDGPLFETEPDVFLMKPGRKDSIILRTKFIRPGEKYTLELLEPFDDFRLKPNVKLSKTYFTPEEPEVMMTVDHDLNGLVGSGGARVRLTRVSSDWYTFEFSFQYSSNH